MKGISTVIFDLDGTLFRTDTVDLAAVNKALALNGFERRSDAETLDCIGSTTQETCTKSGIRGIAAVSEFEKAVLDFEIEEVNRIYHGR